MIQLRYFASLRERLGTGAEAIPCPGLDTPGRALTVADLLLLLRQRGEPWNDALGGSKPCSPPSIRPWPDSTPRSRMATRSPSSRLSRAVNSRSRPGGCHTPRSLDTFRTPRAYLATPHKQGMDLFHALNLTFQPRPCLA